MSPLLIFHTAIIKKKSKRHFAPLHVKMNTVVIALNPHVFLMAKREILCHLWFQIKIMNLFTMSLKS